MSKEKILIAAEKLFVEKGFDGASVRDLSKEAGVNLAMVNYYFGGKEKLLEALVEKKVNDTRSRLEEFNTRQELTSVERLDQIIEYYVDLITNNSRFYQMIHRELGLESRKNLHENLLELISRNWEEVRKALVKGQQEKVFRPDLDTEMVIMTIFGLVNQSSQSKILKLLTKTSGSNSRENIKTRVKNYLKTLLHDHLIIK